MRWHTIQRERTRRAESTLFCITVLRFMYSVSNPHAQPEPVDDRQRRQKRINEGTKYLLNDNIGGKKRREGK